MACITWVTYLAAPFTFPPVSVVAFDLSLSEPYPGFVRHARMPDLIEPLILDVVRPLLIRFTGTEAGRARRIVSRWNELRTR